MRLASFVIASLALCSTAAADHAVSKNKKKVSLSCADDGVVVITGSGNRVTLRGTCTRVTVAGNANQISAAAATSVSVDGNENAITVELVDEIDLLGNDNRVTYRGAVTADREPKVSNLGSRNRVGRTD